MRIEEKIARIERLAVRITSLVLLLLALTALVSYGVIELITFISHL